MDQRRNDEPINAGFWARTLTLTTVKVHDHRLLRRLIKYRPGGVHYTSRFCIKVRQHENLAEAHTMRFVAEHTSIPVPRVVCAFTRRGRAYTVMERIDGQKAARGWIFRSEESKGRVLDQLRRMVQQLRAVPPPAGGGVANVLGGPIYDGSIRGDSFWGPFRTVGDFHRALEIGIDLDRCRDGVPDDVRELAAFHRRPCADVVLTHGDLSSLNVLVRGDEVVGVVDWETAGWYPPYWEYTSACNVNPYNEFWREEVDRFLTPMPYELRMESIRRKCFGDI